MQYKLNLRIELILGFDSKYSFEVIFIKKDSVEIHIINRYYLKGLSCILARVKLQILLSKALVLIVH